ncbi:MAG: biosynthetic arginine decarboxylase [Desulfuromonadaceae bacterium]|nr:biosynthetic arginine decarboxylase [Desulfuromonadaceae bacterium]
MTPETTTHWTIKDAAALYGIDAWGKGNFGLNAAGEVTVKAPFVSGEIAVPLTEIVAGAAARGHNMPLLLRIENLLDDRIRLINETFRAAIADVGYRGEYQGVFPIKVNQQCQVIKEICRFGARYNLGLEAGSKAELLIALASLPEHGLLILNGYKDREFVDLGLWANKLSYRCFFVIESPAELPLIIERSRALGIAPLFGVRVKVSAKVGGLWTETSGDRSSFGLSPTQLIGVVEQLKNEGLLDCLQLLHCHLGSQIPALADIRTGVREASRFYADLVREGAPLSCLDLGGGLAIDYTGTLENQVHSRDYQLADYCHTIVATIAATLEPLGIDHPLILTESGRAMIAHSSLLLFNILDTMHFEAEPFPKTLPPDAHPATGQLFTLFKQLADTDDFIATYQGALAGRDTLRELFRGGEINLRERSLAENIFLAIAQHIASRLVALTTIPAELAGLKANLADIYYGNFSVFQSLPDTWAIGQLFPVMPINRHLEAPTREAIISDLTCDCDGKLDTFIVAGKEQSTLPLHPLRDEEDYLLGVFLMGAYQETLGDLHNLFGDTHVVSIRINEGGGFDVLNELNGDTIAEVLSFVEYHPQTLFEAFRSRVEGVVRAGRMSVAERQQLVEEYAASLNGYTYFEQ